MDTMAKPGWCGLTTRGDLLLEAKNLIDGDRNNQYGPPTQDFECTAKVLSNLGFCFIDREGEIGEIQSHHVAMIQMVVKLSRLAWSPEKRDSWMDIAGYAGCGWECVSESG